VLRLGALRLYESGRRYEKAQALLDAWIASGPSPQRLRLLRGEKLRIFGLAGRLDDAVAYAEKWIRNETPSGRSLPRSTLISVLLEHKAYGKLHAVVDEWIRRSKDAETLRMLRAAKLLAYGREGKFDELVAYGNKWIAGESDPAQASEMVISALVEQKQYDRALKIAEAWYASVRRVATTAPADKQVAAEAAGAIVRVLLQAERYTQAARRARALLKEQGQVKDLLELLATALGSLGRDQEMLEALEKAYHLDPDDPGINNSLGYSWADRGMNLNKAEAMIRKALAARPTEIAFKDSFGWVLYKQGRFAEAKNVFDQVVDVDPSLLHPVILDHAGDTCWRLGLKQEAVRLWRRAVEMAKAAERKDEDVRKVLKSVPKKLSAARRGREPALAPLGRLVETSGQGARGTATVRP